MIFLPTIAICIIFYDIFHFIHLLYDTDEIRYTTAKNYDDEGNLTGETAEAEPTPYQKTANC